jgi:histidinol dehydrogenase
MLLCNSAGFALQVQEEVARQKAALPREGVVDRALENSRIIIFPELDTQLEFADMYAAEHLILAVRDPEAAAAKVSAAGSIFLGDWSPESAGDYASGTNHTLPTSGLANAWSGLGVDSFMHAITTQKLSREGLAGLASTIIEMAEAEGLQAHAEAVRKRIYGNN